LDPETSPGIARSGGAPKYTAAVAVPPRLALGTQNPGRFSTSQSLQASPIFKHSHRHATCPTSSRGSKPPLLIATTSSAKLGSGGMAIVYLEQDLKHRRQVANKALRPELAADFG
jgi:hypothetical protein